MDTAYQRSYPKRLITLPGYLKTSIAVQFPTEKNKHLNLTFQSEPILQSNAFLTTNPCSSQFS